MTKVLVVEDEALVLFDIVMIVEQEGFEVHAACISIEEAQEAMQKGRPDIALLDINVRDQVIWPVARQLKAAGTTVIFSSADASHAELQTEFANCPFVEKPASPAAIGAALKRAAEVA